MTATRKERLPTHVSLVEQALSAADDFLLPSVICSATGLRPVEVRCVLTHLHAYKAANFMEEKGQTFWYLTPDSDTRTKRVAERKPEGDGHRGGAKPRRGSLAHDRVAPGTKVRSPGAA